MSSKSRKRKGWHFNIGKLRNGAPLPPIGKWLKYDGDLILGRQGYHASRRLLDALCCAPFYHDPTKYTLDRVSLRGDVEGETDQCVARERRRDWSLPPEMVEQILDNFTRWCALQVAHLWDAPEEVWGYLKTGDESLRRRAQEAAAESDRCCVASFWKLLVPCVSMSVLAQSESDQIVYTDLSIKAWASKACALSARQKDFEPTQQAFRTARDVQETFANVTYRDRNYPKTYYRTDEVYLVIQQIEDKQEHKLQNLVRQARRKQLRENER